MKRYIGCSPTFGLSVALQWLLGVGCCLTAHAQSDYSASQNPQKN